MSKKARLERSGFTEAEKPRVVAIRNNAVRAVAKALDSLSTGETGNVAAYRIYVLVRAEDNLFVPAYLEATATDLEEHRAVFRKILDEIIVAPGKEHEPFTEDDLKETRN
jgi:hypothetical protein